MIQYEIKPPKKLDIGLQELWDYKELLYFFTWRDIKVKYKQTVLGFLWAIIQPLLLMFIFTLFFGIGLDISSEGIPYPVFVLSGLILWNLFSSGLNGASSSMVVNSNIIKKIYFPRLIIPISSIIVALFDFLMAFIIFLCILIYYQISLSWTLIFYLPLSLMIIILSTFGIGSLLAALNVKYRDFRYVIPFFIQTLFFITPVIYPIKEINSPIGYFLLSLNPISSAIELLRSAITNTSINWVLISLGLSVALIFSIVGLIIFRKTEYYFADLV